MSERGWATLMVRGFGLGMLAYAVSLIGSAFFSYQTFRELSSLSGGAGGGNPWFWLVFGELFSLVAYAILGSYLLTRGEVIIKLVLAGMIGCRRCGYPIEQANPNCPECGTPEPGEKSDP